jgi:flavin reductase (DIM6/NTAB) family NADH-FMN oxidoreductase RutF
MKEHLTAQNIQKTKTFSVNIPNKMILEKLLQCGISGTEKDKSTIFKTFYGTLNVPMIEECAVNYECEVVQTIEIAYCFMFLGEIKGIYIESTCLEESQPNIAKIDPLFASADGKFWMIQAL